MNREWFEKIRNPCTRQDIRLIIESKLHDLVEPNDTLTPLNGEFNPECWEICEATTRGFSLRLLADNKNKIVLDPCHLGYQYQYSPNHETWNPPDSEWLYGDYETESKRSNWRMIKVYEKLSEVIYCELWNHRLTYMGKVDSYLLRLHAAYNLKSLQQCSDEDEVLVIWIFNMDKPKLQLFLDEITYY